jgi:hypothetical protein
MSEQQTPTPLTYEGILELFRQSDLRFQERMDRMSQEAELRKQEADRRWEKIERQAEKTDRQIERTSKEVSALGSRVGQIVENMVGGDITGQFRELGYVVVRISRNVEFGLEGTSESGEIDLLLENGDVAILIEAKTRPKLDDVLGHIERLEKFRSHVNRDGNVERRQFIGAIAGASVESNVIKFAQSKGLYVIVQAGRTVEIVPAPEGFQAKKW